jgi:hypothetical protein
MRRLAPVLAVLAVLAALALPAGAQGASATLTFVAPAKGFTESSFSPPFYPTRLQVASFQVAGLGPGSCTKRVQQQWVCKRGRRIGLACNPSFLGVTCQLWNEKRFGITASVWVRARR